MTILSKTKKIVKNKDCDLQALYLYRDHEMS